MARLKEVMEMPASNDKPYITSKGASTPAPATKQTTKPNSDHSWRTILALRVAEKSAPLKPTWSETEARATAKKRPSRTRTIVFRRVG